MSSRSAACVADGEQVPVEIAVAGGERRDLGPVARAGRLDRTVRRHRGEEELAHDRPLDEEQEVGRAAPQLAGRRLAQLAAQTAPRRSAVSPVGGRVGRAQERGGDRVHRVVDDEPVGPEVHERQAPQAVERLPRRVAGKHGLEQRERRAAGHGRARGRGR
jgi:hypothetical protein